jgi:hypothetical protein
MFAVLSGSLFAQTSIQGDQIAVEFDSNMHSRVIAFGSEAIGPMSASETLVANGKLVADFAVLSQHTQTVSDQLGSGKQLIVEGKSGALDKNSFRLHV